MNENSQPLTARAMKPKAFVLAVQLLVVLTALFFSVVQLAAQSFDGVYRQTANSECALVGVEGGSLRIEDDVFYGVDSVCQMQDPVDITDMEATLYTMSCTSDGEVWSERAMFMEDAQTDGIIMAWNGYAFRYSRCPTETTAPNEDGSDGSGGDEEQAEDASSEVETDGEEPDMSEDDQRDDVSDEAASPEAEETNDD